MRFPVRPPKLIDVGAATPDQMTRIFSNLNPTPGDKYLHWNDLRHRKMPAGLTKEEWWTAVRLQRQLRATTIPTLTDDAGTPFWFFRLEEIDRATHELDRGDAAREMIQALPDLAARNAYRMDQMIEEAISSSVLEGAKLTTRAQAKAIIREGRRPITKGERMVVNNYRAMVRVVELTRTRTPLTLDDLLELHSIIGEESLEVQGAAGRLRHDHEEVRVEDAITGEVWFTPTAAANLPDRLEKMIAFANADSGAFVHPLLRAIVLHFWLGYLHPFVDGNGRMARALFYWQMLRSGYDFAEYLSISGPIDKSPRAYYQAFAYTETDEGDLTYFLQNQLLVLKQATDDLIQHLCERSQRLDEVVGALSNEQLNDRQRALLSDVLRNGEPGTTIRSHAVTYGVTYLTARRDLQELEASGYLRRVNTKGRQQRYIARKDLPQRLTAQVPRSSPWIRTKE